MFASKLKALRVALVTGLALAGIATALPTQAVNITPFTAVYNKNINGQFAMTGNTVLSCSTSEGTNAANCARARTFGTPLVNYNNNAYVMRNSNSGITGLTSSQTVFNSTHVFNSSSATITIPSSATISKAFLFWFGTLERPPVSQGGIAAVNGNDKDKVVFARENETCATTTACTVTGSVATETDTNGNVKFYRTYADVTSKITSGVSWTVSGSEQTAKFTAGNIQTAQGVDRSAGWSLILVYAHPDEPLRNITVYSGFSYVAQQSSEQINLSGFLTPPSGTVTSNVGVVGIEGDYSSTGDALIVTSGNKTTTVSNALNPANNFLNSTVSQDGVRNGYFDNSSADRYQNTFGVDVDRFELVNAVPNSASSASVTFSSNLDTYFPAAMVMANELYAPELQLTKYISNVTQGGTGSNTDVTQGDVVEYTIEIENVGHGAATDIVITDTADPHLTFLSSPMPTGCSLSSGTLTCDIASLAPTTPLGSAAPLIKTFRATVSGADDTSDGLHDFISNHAEAAYGGPLGETETVSNVVNAQYSVQPTDLELVLDFANTFVQAGEVSNLTATITNLGIGADTAPFIDITIPTGLTPDLAGTSCTQTGQVITCPAAAFGISGAGLAAGDSASRTIAMTTELAGASSFEVSGHVTTGNIDGDPNSYNDTATALLEANHAPTATPAEIFAEQGGAAQVVDLSLGTSDPDSDSLRYVVGSLAAQYGTLKVVGSTVTFTPNSTWYGGKTITYDVYDDKGGHVQSEITIHVSKAPEVLAPELEITKHISNLTTGGSASTQVTAGDTIEYTIVVDNIGQGDARNIVLKDKLDSHVTFVSATPAGCQLISGTVTCTLGTLGASAPELEIVITATVGAGTSPTTFSNDASATYAGPSGALSAVSNQATTEYAKLPTDLSVQVSFAKQLIQAGQTSQFTVRIENFGIATDPNPTFTITIPSGLKITSNVSGCTQVGDQLTCTGAQWSLASGASSDTSFAFIAPSNSSRLSIGANIVTSVADGDPNDANNTAYAGIRINRKPSASPATISAKQGGTSKKVDLASKISDLDGDSLKVSLAHLSSKYGKASVSGTVVTFKPNSTWFGSTKLTYTVDDGRGGTTTSFITISVKKSASSATHYCFVGVPTGC